jgi:hypothetical protein
MLPVTSEKRRKASLSKLADMSPGSTDTEKRSLADEPFRYFTSPSFSLQLNLQHRRVAFKMVCLVSSPAPFGSLDKAPLPITNGRIAAKKGQIDAVLAFLKANM